MKEINIKKLSLVSDIIITVICLGPPLWLIWGTFENIPEQNKIYSSLLSIPCLIIIGFVWGQSSKEKEIMKWASEADELEKKLKELQESSKK
ncbi:hypothetical protein [Lactococcus fujiensis]|uniref:Uncharacterized protein n=1 Tax=Lactococcus fujiensis JCM 16395 TaxID=1291764 RepID=A0A2A5RI78_9LACT|nr:hypothetical protein [Lactococcus fujiensis]PCR98746.1 hypothetical protein RT41_GL000926 [Lactococcus fujiensis JCM 16395]